MGLLSGVAAARHATIKLIGALHKFVGPGNVHLGFETMGYLELIVILRCSFS